MNGIQKRKKKHLIACLEKDVSFKEKTTGFEDVELVYQAIPEINKEDIDLRTNFLGKKFSAPILVNAMTGGFKEAGKINKDLAFACEKLGLGMCLGSQRAMIEDRGLSRTYKIRDIAPNIFLAGNIGMAQLNEFSLKEIEWALKEVKADALAIHLNAGQELIQKDKKINFMKRINEIRQLSSRLSKPVYVKEVGQGISRDVVRKLNKTKIAAIDVSGSGGTNWMKTDALVRGDPSWKTFEDFGIPTAWSLIEAKSATKKPLIASGGIRNGLDAVKAIALGAGLVGIALPVLKESGKGRQAIMSCLNNFIEEMRITMALINARNLKGLGKQKPIILGRTRQWLDQRKIKY